MYICLECDALFEEPAAYSESHGLDSPPYETWNGCPECGSGAFAETELCSYCGKYITGDYIILPDGDYVCDGCYMTGSIEDLR